MVDKRDIIFMVENPLVWFSVFMGVAGYGSGVQVWPALAGMRLSGHLAQRVALQMVHGCLPDQPLLQHQKVLTHGFAGLRRIA